MNFAEKYRVLVELWKTQYKLATGGEKLTNSDFAGILKISREHFQRVLGANEIDERAYEDLLSRFILWHLATKRNVPAKKALNVNNNEAEFSRFIVGMEPEYPPLSFSANEPEAKYDKSGQKPDYIMEVINQEVETFKSNLHMRLTGSVSVADPGTSKVSKKGRMDLSLDRTEGLNKAPQLKSEQKDSSVKKSN